MKNTALFLFCFLFTVYSKAQGISEYVIGYTSGIAADKNYSFQYEGGELVTTTVSTGSTTFTQGFLQPNYVSIIGGLRDEANQVPIVYPNPFSDHLQVGNMETGSVVQLLNALGVLVVETTGTSIPTSMLPSGIYFIRILSPQGAPSNYLKLVKYES